MKNPSRQTLVLANATRLLSDARLLVEHRRFASGFALAVLGVEEIGKAVMDGWSAEMPRAKPRSASQSAHIQKQGAVASLLLGTLAVRLFPAGSTADLEGD